MASATRRILGVILICLGLIIFAGDHLASSQAPLPNPVLVFMGAEHFETGNKSFVRYRYFVDNFAAYPKALFEPAPTLPPCGANTKSSRTWVDVYEQNGKRLNGFCALGSPNNLEGLWFALEEGVVPPSWIYIEFNDRQTTTKYKSNLAESTL